MIIRATIVTVCTVILAAAGMAWAQDSATDQGSSAYGIEVTTNSTDSATAPRTLPPPSGPTINAAWQRALTQEFCRAGGLMGKEAQGSRGENLGTIKDVVFNQQGQVFVLIDVGDGRLVPIPWRLANMASAKGRSRMSFNISGAAVREGPVVTNDQWGELDNPNFTEGILAYYRDQSATATGASGAPAGSSQGEGANAPQTTTPTETQ